MTQGRRRGVSRKQIKVNIKRAAQDVIRGAQAAGLTVVTTQMVINSSRKFNVSQSEVAKQLQGRGIEIR